MKRWNPTAIRNIPLVAEFKDHAGETILEIGCGLGTDGRQFARGGARYIAIDLSLHSLKLAAQGFQLFNLPGRFIHGDAERLPFRDNFFDLVYSHGVLHHTPDTHQAIKEVYRVLHPGGKAIVMLYNRHSFHYWIGTRIVAQLRLELIRFKIGREAFNNLVGLPSGYRGWLPHQVVISNSTDGVGNPLSKFYTRRELRLLFSDFNKIDIEVHYIPRRKIPIFGKYIPDLLSYWLGRVMGTCLYVKAVK